MCGLHMYESCETVVSCVQLTVLKLAFELRKSFP